MATQDLSPPLDLIDKLELSPVTRYYINQLVRHNFDRLIVDIRVERSVEQGLGFELHDGPVRLERLAL